MGAPHAASFPGVQGAWGKRLEWGFIVRTGGFGAGTFPFHPLADSSQGWLSWICHGIITSLVFLLMVVTFPISGWFALKVREESR